VSKLRRPHPGNFSDDLVQLIAELGQANATGISGERRTKYLPRRAARSPALHNRLLFGEIWR